MTGCGRVSRWGRVGRSLLAGLVVTVAVGCGYHPVGMGSPASATRRVAVEAITNETMRPGIQGIVGAAVLAGELSTLSAQSAGQLGSAHSRLGR